MKSGFLQWSQFLEFYLTEELSSLHHVHHSFNVFFNKNTSRLWNSCFKLWKQAHAVAGRTCKLQTPLKIRIKPGYLALRGLQLYQFWFNCHRIPVISINVSFLLTILKCMDTYACERLKPLKPRLNRWGIKKQTELQPEELSSEGEGMRISLY